MSKDLDLLIDFYQWEIQRIKVLIDEHKEMHHYQELVLDDRALQKAYSELDKLLLLKNPNYYKLQDNQMMLESLKRLDNGLKEKYKGHLEDSFISDEIRVYQKEAQRLSESAPSSREETQIIDEALYNIWEERITAATLVFKGYDSTITLDISKIENFGFLLRLCSDNSNENRYLVEKDVLKELRFRFNENTKMYESSVKLESSKNILLIKEFLARLIYGLKRELSLSDEFHIKMET